MQTPKIHENTYLAPGAQVLYNVELSSGCSVWCNAVIRGMPEAIFIGENSNIQDCAVLHADINRPVNIGKGVTVGHSAIVHSCTIGDNVVIGMGSIILDGAVIGENSIVGAGSIVTKNTIVPPCSLVLGSPAKVKRSLTDEEIEGIRESCAEYLKFMHAAKKDET